MADYDRYWELHVTGTTGFYDFAPSIRDQRAYQLNTHGAHLPGHATLVWPDDLNIPGVINPLLLPPALPDAGYVASMVTVTDLGAHTVHATTQALAAWINDPAHKGKLRVNAHGNGVGQIGMADGTGPIYPVTYVNAAEIVTWLAANGLAAIVTTRTGSLAGDKNRHGLVTVNLAVCMGGRSGTTPASLNFMQTNSDPAPGSAVDGIARAFAAHGMRGIEVTGSNEITMDGASGVLGQWGRTFGLGGRQVPELVRRGDRPVVWDLRKPGTGGVEIVVPDGWTVNPAWFGRPGGTLAPPAGFTAWAAQGATPSAGWVIRNAVRGEQIEVPPGWIGDQLRGVILPPLGFKITSNGAGRGGLLTSITEANAPFTGMGQRMAHSAAKVRVIS